MTVFLRNSLYLLSEFLPKSPARKSPMKYFFWYFILTSLAWGLHPGFAPNKPTHPTRLRRLYSEYLNKYCSEVKSLDSRQLFNIPFGKSFFTTFKVFLDIFSFDFLYIFGELQKLRRNSSFSPDTFQSLMIKFMCTSSY